MRLVSFLFLLVTFLCIVLLWKIWPSKLSTIDYPDGGSASVGMPISVTDPPPFGGEPDIKLILPDKKIMTIHNGNSRACDVGCVAWVNTGLRNIQAKDAGVEAGTAEGETMVLLAKKCFERCAKGPAVGWDQ